MLRHISPMDTQPVPEPLLACKHGLDTAQAPPILIPGQTGFFVHSMPKSEIMMNLLLTLELQFLLQELITMPAVFSSETDLIFMVDLEVVSGMVQPMFQEYLQ